MDRPRESRIFFTVESLVPFGLDLLFKLNERELYEKEKGSFDCIPMRC